MKESVTYQAILEEGEALAEAKGEIKGIRRALLYVGEKRFGGPPDARVKEDVEAVSDPEALLQLVRRLLEVRSWEHLFPQAPQNPLPRRRKRNA